MGQNKEIPKGYRDSPLGVIPEKWEVMRLEKVCSFYSGGTPSKDVATYWNGNIPWISAATMHKQNINSSDLFITKEGLLNGSKLANNGDLLLLVRGSMLWNKIPICECFCDVAFNQDVKKIKAGESVMPKFLLYWFLSQENYLLHQVVGTGIGAGKLETQDLKDMLFALPPLPEQQKIAEILSTWDKAIEKQTALIEKLELRKRGLMQQLLTGKKQLINATSWQMIKAGSIFKNVSNKGFENERLLSATQENGVIPRDMLESRVTMPSGETKSFKLVEIGDFVISLRSFQGGIEYSYYRGIVSPAYTVLKPKQEICNEYYKQYFKSCDFISRLAVAVIGIRDGKQISYDDFCFIKIPSPSLAEQIKIANILIAADKEIDLARTKLITLRTEKDGLMQQLLTGKKRIN